MGHVLVGAVMGGQLVLHRSGLGGLNHPAHGVQVLVQHDYHIDLVVRAVGDEQQGLVHAGAVEHHVVGGIGVRFQHAHGVVPVVVDLVVVGGDLVDGVAAEAGLIGGVGPQSGVLIVADVLPLGGPVRNRIHIGGVALDLVVHPGGVADHVQAGGVLEGVAVVHGVALIGLGRVILHVALDGPGVIELHPGTGGVVDGLGQRVVGEAVGGNHAVHNPHIEGVLGQGVAPILGQPRHGRCSSRTGCGCRHKPPAGPGWC